MNKIALSPAAAGLIRAISLCFGVERNRILLSHIVSIDWQSLTFIGEQHHLELRITGPDAVGLVERMARDLAPAELTIAGHFVADIEAMILSVEGESATLRIEALTIEDA